MATEKRRGGAPGLPADQVEKIRHEMRKTLEEGPYAGHGGRTRLAKALGVSQPRISQFLDNRSGREGISLATAHAFARLRGVDLDDLFGGPSTVTARYPNLKAMFAYWGEEKWHPSVVAAARSGWWPDDVSPQEWASRLDELEEMRSGVGKKRRHPN